MINANVLLLPQINDLCVQFFHLEASSDIGENERERRGLSEVEEN